MHGVGTEEVVTAVIPTSNGILVLACHQCVNGIIGDFLGARIFCSSNPDYMIIRIWYLFCMVVQLVYYHINSL